MARRLSERDLDRLSDIDHRNHEALAAIEPGTDDLPVLDWGARAGGVAEAHDGDAALYSISLGRAEADQNAA